MTQQPLFVPASDGWYARPGDPPGVVRHWNGKTWQCEIRGPIVDHFNHLRSMLPEQRSPEDQDLLRRLTRDVSTIEDMVLANPSDNPPLVPIQSPPPYLPPPSAAYAPAPPTPVYMAPPPAAAPQAFAPQALSPQGFAPQAAQPPMYAPQAAQPPMYAPQAAQPPMYAPRAAQPPMYAPQAAQSPMYPPTMGPGPSLPVAGAHGMPGPAVAPGGTPRFSASRSRKPRRLMVVAVPVLLLVVLGLVGYSLRAKLPFVAAAASLAVDSCVTLAGTGGGTDVTWSSSECATKANGPVSYVVVSKLPGVAQCDPDSQFVQTTAGKAVDYTYCLMENLDAGECVFQDDKGLLFDVPCSDTRALIKITFRADQGSGYTCPTEMTAWRFPSGNRTYCLSKP